ncbi:MAG TPA: cobaltochelatase subunit CobN, partial [Dehalococcoidia bacterium]|nr:cobaltochelatase subunit CobN [Dehalococcoidia bacterium]
MPKPTDREQTGMDTGPQVASKNTNIVFVSTADTDLLTADRALAEMPYPDFPQVLAFNPAKLDTPEAQGDLLEGVASAGAVVLRLLGGKRTMPETFDKVVQLCHSLGVPLVACPGHQEWDEDLVSACSVSVAEVDTVFAYLMRGGVSNFRNLFIFLSDSYCGTDFGPEAPAPTPWEGIYHPDVAEGMDADSFTQERFLPGKPKVGLLFYRAHWMSGNLQAVDALVRKLEELGADVLPIFSFSLKHNPADEAGRNESDGPTRALSQYLAQPDGSPRVHCVINTMGMSMGDLSKEGTTISSGWAVDYLEQLNIPVIQAIMSTGTEAQWLDSSLGLGPIDTAMSVALPEFDGRIITVPISFKEESQQQSGRMRGQLQRYVPRPDRVDLVARLAVKWSWLRLKPNREKKIAIILSNYPTKDARIGNAVGLDTPASVIRILNALSDAGYQVDDIPKDGDELVHRIIERCSNDLDTLTEEQLRLAVGHVSTQQYGQWFQDFPEKVKQELSDSWGEPPGQVYRSNGYLAIAGIDLGNVFVGLQPPRGFGQNPIAVYHSPDLTPTHHYIAYYRWISEVFGADAMIHVGKHGTLEWLPGKGIGLSETCYPELALQDMPLFYPFIINNPGEGAQAKRRAHATIIDHLIPAMTTADSYGDIARLEQLLDEHYQCQTLDPAKLPILEAQIWELVKQAELNRDLGVDTQPDDFGEFILHIDGYLCE